MSSHPASDGESTLPLVTARSSSISLTPTNSSISGDDIDNKNTPPKSGNEQHGGAGDNIGRNYHDQSPTSRQATTSRRRRRTVIPRHSKDYGTPQAPPKRHLGGSGMGGYASSYMPMSYSQNKSDGLFAFDDIDVLLYTVKELCALVESERFVCGPTFMAQFQVLTQRILFVTRNLAQRCRQNAFSPPLVKPSLYDSLLRVRSHDLLNPAHDFSRTTRESPRDESSVLPSGERVLKRSKVMVPEHPNYNFIGRILGPRGISVRQLEASSGCGILIRGKGSVKNAEREERLRSRNTPGFEHLKEPLRVLITAEGDGEAECDAKLDKCKRRIEKLLKPEYDEFKRRQLAQLAMINGNYDATRGIAPTI
jgi:hypothetical protein